MMTTTQLHETSRTDTVHETTEIAETEGAGAPILVDVFHDTTCPWCRIGLTAFQQAIAGEGWDGPPIEMHWHPFLLNRDTPLEGEPFQAALGAKMGQDPAPMLERVSEAGRAVGLTFNWPAVTRMPNTIRSHLLYAILPDERRTGMIERLQTAYFEDGRDIGDLDTLKAIATEAGVDADLAAVAVQRTELRDAIVTEADEAVSAGVSGVPLFIIDGRLAVNGAQPPDAYRQALDLVARERAGADPAVGASVAATYADTLVTDDRSDDDLVAAPLHQEPEQT